MPAIDRSTYGAAAAKSQNASAPCSCSSAERPGTSLRMPVTLEAAENEPILSGRSACSDELGGEERLVDVPVGVLGADHDVGDRLAPRQLVGVVLERADEDDRPLVGRDVVGEVRAGPRAPRGSAGRGCRSAWRSRRCCPSPAKITAQSSSAPHGLVHQPPRVLAQPRGLQAGAARLGVGVGVAGEHLAPDEVLEEADRAAGRRVVGVRHPTRPERARHHVVVADHRLPDPAQQRSLDRTVLPSAMVEGSPVPREPICRRASSAGSCAETVTTTCDYT